MLPTNKQRITQLFECIKKFHSLEVLPPDIPNPQTPGLLPVLRSYQVKAVNWMLWKELFPSYYQNEGGSTSSEAAVLLPRGGVLADEMGLGKTVEVLALILTNTRQIVEEKAVVQEETPLDVEMKGLETSHKDSKTNECKIEVKINKIENNELMNSSKSETIGEPYIELGKGAEDLGEKTSQICIVEPPPRKKRSRKSFLFDPYEEKNIKKRYKRSSNLDQSDPKKMETDEKPAEDSETSSGRPKQASAVKAGETFSLLKVSPKVLAFIY